MRRGSEWLSRGAELLALSDESGATRAFDVVVVGSGYGGAVAAARLSAVRKKDGTPVSVCVLERGREYLPGDFPSSFEELPTSVRMRRQDEDTTGIRDGLFDFKLAGDVSALVANGLGGGSLINAGVAEPADQRTLSDAAWPAAWRDPARWASLYSRARQKLKASAWPAAAVGQAESMGSIREALSRAGLNATQRRVAVTIAPPMGTLDSIVPLHPCTQCGDCFTGCNVGAKVTLTHTYLHEARAQGVEIYTGAEVVRITKAPPGATHRWEVEFALTDSKRLRSRTRPFRVLAGHVVLAAGTFGSTEILFRSRSDDLRFSPQLGQRFSANGDTIGAQYALPMTINGYAEERVRRDSRLVGPTITDIVDLRDGASETAGHRIAIENLVVPAAMSWLFGELLTSLMVPQRWVHTDRSTRRPEDADPYVVDDTAPGNAMHRSLLLATQGNDGAGGALEPEYASPRKRDFRGLTVKWPDVGKQPYFMAVDRLLQGATDGPAYWLRNPLWQGVPNSPLLDEPKTRGVVTVHPLGGCTMAESWRDGVVDGAGRVYDVPADRADSRSTVHAGLYVLDGSIVPLSLGINPLLTITAIDEGALDDWIDRASQEHGWQCAAPANPSAPPRTLAPLPIELPAAGSDPVDGATSVRFHERMRGALVGPRSWSPLLQRLPVELSLKCDFGEIADLRQFLREHHKHLPLQATLSTSLTRWSPTNLRFTRSRLSRTDVSLPGDVYWFEQQTTGPVRRLARSLWAWIRNRSRADIGTHLGWLNRCWPGLFPQASPALVDAGFFGICFALFKALTHFGAPRLLRYELGTLPSEWTLAHDDQGSAALSLPAGTRLYGAKSLVYTAKESPWRQLTQLDLMAKPPGRRAFLLAKLEFDELFMIDRDRLPLRVVAQPSATLALRDTLSLALFFGRTVAGTHFPTFRAPNYAQHEPPKRLPVAYTHGESKFSHLEFAQHTFRIPTRARDSQGSVDLVLTHLRHPGPLKDRTPVLMLHGFGASGTLFTHDKIRIPMAAFLADEERRDVWVGELRTSIGLPSSRHQWSMDDVAQEDVPALVREVLRRSNATQLDIVAHCIGSAMFCMATLSGLLDGLVRRASLMQVGPVVHLPRTNRLRGYLGHRGQQTLGKGFVESTMDDRAVDGDVLLDRIAGSYPYLGTRLPGNWQDRLLQDVTLGWTLRHNQRRLNVLRSAAVFGQLFQWPNMDDADLIDALPELLGHCNLTTYQQTVYYAFVRRLTNQAGEDAYVTDAHIKAFMPFPVLFIQGELNDTFDRRGTLESARLIRRVHGAGHPVFRRSVPGYGHLDCVVGREAPTLVYPHIASFLRDGVLDPRFADDLTIDKDEARLHLRQPVIGPWIGQVQTGDDASLIVRLGLKVDESRVPPPCIVSVVVVDGQPRVETLVFHGTDDTHLPPSWAPGTCRAEFAWKEGEAVIGVHVSRDVLADAVERIGIRVCTPFSGDTIVWPASAKEFVAVWERERQRGGVRENDFDDDTDDERIDEATLSRSHLDLLRGSGRIRFALGSCRQTPVLIDRDLADAAFRRLLQEESRGEGPRPYSHVLLVGDQIYADAMASVESVRGTRARFVDAHREAWCAPAQRAVMRSRPVYMAIDDHEFTDNYDDSTRRDFPREFRSARDAWWRYQLAAGPAGRQPGHPRSAWYRFEQCGFAFFVCDTRSQRIDGGRIDRTDARIMSDLQKAALTSWVEETRSGGAKPRFVVLPSPPFPFFADAQADPAYRVRSDAWQRFPDCLDWLLRLIWNDGTGSLVLLCGDYHIFADCTLTLEGPEGRTVTSRCVTTSGLYCPYRFANTDVDELAPRSEGSTSEFRWHAELVRAAPGSGFTSIEVDEAGRVDVRFVREESSSGQPI